MKVFSTKTLAKLVRLIKVTAQDLVEFIVPVFESAKKI
jgi:hypothetical protein